MLLEDVILQSRAVDPIVYARKGGPGDMTLDMSEILAIFLEALIFGVEALTFVATVYLLHGANRNKYLFIKFSSVIAMFLLNTIHLGTSFRRILNAFLGTAGEPIPDPTGYLADFAGFLYRFKNILVIVQTLILDVLVTYRCYMVWDKKFWAALVPLPSILAYLVAGIASIHAYAVIKSDTFTGLSNAWISAALCISLFTKLVCSTIVVLAIYLPRPKSTLHSTYLKVDQFPMLRKAIIASIECGGLAGLGAFILVPVYLAGRNAQSIVWATMSPLTGESFLLIITASLLGMTPSTGGVSRRRKGGIRRNRFSLPTISIGSAPSPGPRSSVRNSILKPSSLYGATAALPDLSKPKIPFTQADAAIQDSDKDADSRLKSGNVAVEPSADGPVDAPQKEQQST